MTDLAATDAHALIWAATGQRRRLGRAARRFYDRVDAGTAALYIPVVALVEIGEAHHAGEIAFARGASFGSWMSALLDGRRFTKNGRRYAMRADTERLRLGWPGLDQDRSLARRVVSESRDRPGES